MSEKRNIICDDTCYNEIYAMVKLQFIFSIFRCISIEDKFNKKMKFESPDFQSLELDSGIEITRATSDSYEKYLMLLRNEAGRNNKIEDFEDFINSEKINVDFFIEESFGHPSVLFIEDIENHIERIKKTLIKKNKKFSKNYKKFGTNFLYIACLEQTTKNDLISVVNNIKILFDVVFFDCEHRFYEYNVKSKIFNEYRITDKELVEIKQKAFSYYKPKWANR